MFMDEKGKAAPQNNDMETNACKDDGRQHKYGVVVIDAERSGKTTEEIIQEEEAKGRTAYVNSLLPGAVISEPPPESLRERLGRKIAASKQ